MNGLTLYPDADPLGLNVLSYGINRIVPSAFLPTVRMARGGRLTEVSHPYKRDRNPNNPRPEGPNRPTPNRPSIDPTTDRAEGLLDWLTT